MNKKIILFISFILLWFLAFWTYIIYNKKTNNTKQITQNKQEKQEIKKDEENIKKEEEKKEKNIDSFKKSLQAKWLIIKWDINLKNNDYILALQKFLQANKQTPNNPKIISKIAKTYFLMKRYDLAFKNYSKLQNLSEEEKENKVLSFLYSQNLEEYNFTKNSSWVLVWTWKILLNNLKQEIEKLSLDKEEKFYLKNSLKCIEDFHSCKANFENYFKNTNYSWKNQHLENIRNAITNYNNLQLNELYYKNALIIWAFLQNKLYPVAIILSKELLKEKKNYKPLLKIIAQSYYNLWKTDEAKKYLLEYTKLDTQDPDVSYMLWAINQKQHNYIQSNIFLDLALKQNYFDKDSIYRLKLYNYLMLEQKEKINSTFDKIISLQKEPSFNDLVLASYYNIIDNNYSKALLYIEKWLKLYPEKEDFYWLKAWILIERGDLENAKKLLKKAEEINPRNAVIALNLWRIEIQEYKETNKKIQKLRAKIFLRKAMELDNTEIWTQAQKLLNSLENIQDTKKTSEE